MNTEYYNYDTNVTQGKGINMNTYIARTYGWMALGLFVTFAVAYGMYVAGLADKIASFGGAAIVALFCIELILISVLTHGLHDAGVWATRARFLMYSAVHGVIFTVYFLYFDATILMYAFAATSLLFGGMAAASLIFKLNLDSFGSLLFCGLFVLLIVTILRLFFDLRTFDVAICYFGIAIFLGYTAYDTSKIRENYERYSDMGADVLERASIYSALELYLDFINMFLQILRLFSRGGGGSSK